MDIHKPRAAHSWREFLIEIGTIVCGILIALGLEQVVEAVHRGAEVKEAREALNAEVSLDLGVYQHFLEHRICFDARLDEISRWLESPAAARGSRFPATLPDPQLLYGSSSDWSIATGAVAKMPFKVRSRYALFYTVLSVDQRNLNIFYDQWAYMQRYLTAHSLDSRERDALAHQVKVVRNLGDSTAYNYDEFIKGLADKLDLKPNQAWFAPDEKARAAKMCKPLLPTPDGL